MFHFGSSLTHCYTNAVSAMDTKCVTTKVLNCISGQGQRSIKSVVDPNSKLIRQEPYLSKGCSSSSLSRCISWATSQVNLIGLSGEIKGKEGPPKNLTKYLPCTAWDMGQNLLIWALGLLFGSLRAILAKCLAWPGGLSSGIEASAICWYLRCPSQNKLKHQQMSEVEQIGAQFQAMCVHVQLGYPDVAQGPSSAIWRWDPQQTEAR